MQRFEWQNDAGFSIDASVRVEADGAWVGFARARCADCGHDFLVVFSCKGRTVCPSCNTRRMGERRPNVQWTFAAHPPPQTHRHRYHGVLAPNATLRAAVTALAPETSNTAQQKRRQEKKDTEDAVEALWRSPARYLWAMLLARIYESAPLACPQCGTDMRIIAFVTDGVAVRRILTPIGGVHRSH